MKSPSSPKVNSQLSNRKKSPSRIADNKKEFHQKSQAKFQMKNIPLSKITDPIDKLIKLINTNHILNEEIKNDLIFIFQNLKRIGIRYIQCGCKLKKAPDEFWNQWLRVLIIEDQFFDKKLSSLPARTIKKFESIDQVIQKALEDPNINNNLIDSLIEEINELKSHLSVDLHPSFIPKIRDLQSRLTSHYHNTFGIFRGTSHQPILSISISFGAIIQCLIENKELKCLSKKFTMEIEKSQEEIQQIIPCTIDLKVPERPKETRVKAFSLFNRQPSPKNFSQNNEDSNSLNPKEKINLNIIEKTEVLKQKHNVSSTFVDQIKKLENENAQLKEHLKRLDNDRNEIEVKIANVEEENLQRKQEKIQSFFNKELQQKLNSIKSLQKQKDDVQTKINNLIFFFQQEKLVHEVDLPQESNKLNYQLSKLEARRIKAFIRSFEIAGLERNDILSSDAELFKENYCLRNNLIKNLYCDFRTQIEMIFLHSATRTASQAKELQLNIPNDSIFEQLKNEREKYHNTTAETYQLLNTLQSDLYSQIYYQFQETIDSYVQKQKSNQLLSFQNIHKTSMSKIQLLRQNMMNKKKQLQTLIENKKIQKLESEFKVECKKECKEEVLILSEELQELSKQNDFIQKEIMQMHNQTIKIRADIEAKKIVRALISDNHVNSTGVNIKDQLQNEISKLQVQNQSLTQNLSDSYAKIREIYKTKEGMEVNLPIEILMDKISQKFHSSTVSN